MIQSQLFWCIQTDFERVLSEKLSSKCQDNNTLGTYCGVNDESWIEMYEYCLFCRIISVGRKVGLGHRDKKNI